MSFELFNIYTTSLIFFSFLFINLKKVKNIDTENKPNLISTGNNAVVDKRVYFFDFIKGIAIVGVILGHVAYFYYNFNTGSNINLAIFQSYMVKIYRFVIPFFLISSGFLLSLRDFSKNTLFDFYKSKFLRLIVPYFIVCVAIYLFKNLNNLNIYDFVVNFFDGKLSIPFYFMSVLLQLYILYPLIVFLFKKFNRLTVLILCFFFSFISFLVLNNIGEFYFFGPYLVYFSFGIYLKLSSKETNILELIGSKKFIYFYIFTIILYFLFGIIGPRDHYSNFQFAYSIAMFLLFFAYREKMENKFKVIALFGKNSLYVFLIHFTIMEFIYNLIKNKLNVGIEFILFILLSFVFGLLLPTLISILIQKFQVLRKT